MGLGAVAVDNRTAPYTKNGFVSREKCSELNIVCSYDVSSVPILLPDFCFVCLSVCLFNPSRKHLLVRFVLPLLFFSLALVHRAEFTIFLL